MSEDDGEPGRLLGAHMPTAGGPASSLVSGHKIGCTAVQLFTGNPRQWAHPPLRDEAIDAFREARQATGIGCVVAHDSYLINLAAPDFEILDRSRKAFRRELERADALGIPWVVTHMGAHLGSGEEMGLEVLTASVLGLLDETEGMCAGIALENTAGQGTCLGWRFEHLARVMEGAGAHVRLGACFDTCHAFAAGYDVSSPEGYEATIERLAAVVGLQALKVVHANDAKRPLGSRVDRHEHIGRGYIGMAAFARLLRDERLRRVPVIVETPDAETMHRVNVARLRRLAAGGTMGVQVKVRFFGHFSEMGLDGLELDVPGGSTVAGLASEIASRDARFERLARYCRAAVNEEYAGSDAVLQEGDEVAFIPPMSGG
ncbi:MAG: deoxyribonuclease IV [Chthonomonadales bacterium]|nr:deoxyribonuclease IV [Chthonomonadales bacterium]